MNNEQIAEYFSLLSKLMDIHGENSFKSKSYSAAAFTIDKLPQQLCDTPHEKIYFIKGIGESTGKKIIELLQTGQLQVLNQLIEKTPEGILEMLRIKGIGPKKIATIWKEMEIETLGELLYACKENRLKLYKGFGEKTQQSVAEAIEFYFKSKGSFLFAQVHAISDEVKSFFEKIFTGIEITYAGAYARHLEIIEELDIVADTTSENVKQVLSTVDDFDALEVAADSLLYQSTATGLKIRIWPSAKTGFIKTLFRKNASPEFEAAFSSRFPAIQYNVCKNEADVFEQASINFIPAFQRENPAVLEHLPNTTLLQPSDIKGIIHSHSNWSDGSNTIEEMARAAIDKGLEYLVISDHSKSAFYANGLTEERLHEQHRYIDELNQKLAPFTIFKSIESDILNDGKLDYSNSILSTFDLVIASVHSNLKMTEEKAMLRLITAIENPYTTILGHLTGRLLLSRKGYPVNHKRIIDACAANNVVIELNAHPSRLDIDWRQIDYALQKNVLISINPDAHNTEGFNDTYYGVLVAQKAFVSKENNLSSFSRDAFQNFIQQRKAAKCI
ncbi:MAG TPA: PHP domain-containing protein [Ferruginibacter sp.]|nr:PHP domain-containing protein [Ferruginibacter sp.]HMP21439.1 PHP domain-containing protein [Ferruginibacter sp.]